MDFEKVLHTILDEFVKYKIRYAIIGGFAMGALGIMRSTVDLDFLVNYDDIAKIENIMSGHMYRCIYKTENVSQYFSDVKSFGQIDFLHAFRTISLSMLDRAIAVPIFNKSNTIRVLAPEDIIGLKVQALSNDPERELQEYADIQLIVKHFRGKLNWELIKDFFYLFNKEKEYEELKKKYSSFK